MVFVEEVSNQEAPRASTPTSDPSRNGAVSSKWSAAFEAVIHRILAEYEGQDAKVRDGMGSAMRKLFENPYHVELGTLCGDGPLEVEEAQRVFFFPRLSDMRRYVEAFCLDTPEETARRARLMKFKLMSVFYTLHKRDGALVDRFMHCGGLDALVRLVGEDHNVIQSQAVELLMEMLSPLMQLPHATSLRQRHLHHCVFSCLRSQAFWENLARVVAEPAEVFPKSHTNCVRILAGALGWLRPEEGCPPEAGSPPDLRQVVNALQYYLDKGPPKMPEARGLAEDLLQELSGAPTFRVDPLRGPELEEARSGLFSRDAEASEDAAHVWQAMRRLGNEAFKCGQLWPAEAAYRLALEAGGSAIPASEASLIESNRALTLLRAGHFCEAATAADCALRHNPNNAKAAYRRAQALLEQPEGDPSDPEVAANIRAAKAAAELAAELQPKDAKVVELLAQARVRAEKLPPLASTACAAGVALQKQSEDSLNPDGPTPHTMGLNDMD